MGLSHYDGAVTFDRAAEVAMDTGVGLAKRTGSGSWLRPNGPDQSSEMARRYDIDLRMLRRWKREVTQQATRERRERRSGHRRPRKRGRVQASPDLR